MTHWLTSRWLDIAAFSAGLAALGFLCWTFGLHDLLAAWRRLAPRSVVAYVGCGCIVRLGYSLRWRLVTATLGREPALTRLLLARLAGDAVGSVLPGGRIGGDPVRVALLCRDGMSAIAASAGVAVDRIMETLSNTVCAIAYVIIFSLARTGAASHGVALAVIPPMGFLLTAVGIPVVLLRRGIRPFEPVYRLAARWGTCPRSTWIKKLRETEDLLMRFFADHPAAFAGGFVASLLIEGLIVVEYHFLLRAFGVRLDVPTLLMVLLATGLARVVPTPAALGALEAGQVTLLATTAGDPGLGFVIGMVIRLHETLWSAVGLALLSVQGVSMTRLRALASAGKPAPGEPA